MPYSEVSLSCDFSYFLDTSVMEIKSAYCLVRFAGLVVIHSYSASSWTKLCKKPSKQSNDAASNLQSSRYPCVIDFKTKSADCKNRQLAEIPDYLLEDIVTLDLSKNELQTLRNISFRRYTRVEILDLSANNITFIEEGKFFHLDRLRSLDLGRNRYLGRVNSSIFKWCSMLSRLFLSSCNILTFPGDLFRWSPQLIDLYMTFNSVPSLSITICPKKTISYLNFEWNKVQSITNETFILNCSCDTLNLRSNPIRLVDPGVISSLPVRKLEIGGRSDFTEGGCSEYTKDAFKNIFKGIGQSGIEEVNISKFCCFAVDTLEMLSEKHLKKVLFEFSELKACLSTLIRNLPRVDELTIYISTFDIIRPEDFNQLRLVQTLILSDNEISTINEEPPWNITLDKLCLDSNHLKQITSNTFNGLKGLRYLDLSGNRELICMSFSQILNLEFINLSQTVLQNFWIENMTNLATLLYTERGYLLHSEMFFFSLDSFQGKPSLKYVDISDSFLYLFTIWDSGSGRSMFDGLKRLMVLKLENNFITKIPVGLFSDLVSLSQLNLRHCQIANIERDAFHNMSSLSCLNLQDNKIFFLPPNLFSTASHLRVLNLESNHLSFLYRDLFVNTSEIVHLTLRGNELISVNHSTFTPIQSSLRFMDLSENPLECTCELKWLVQWLKLSDDIQQENKATCSPASKNIFRGQSIVAIDANQLCHSYVDLYCSIPILIFILLIAIAIIHHKRWVLRYKIFLLKLGILGFREIRDTREANDFRFDLNIMFTGADETWAAEYLRPIIQERLPRFKRIVFGDDDLPLGMYYLDAVLHVIENSFKTVMLLSKAATRDDEFMLKLRIALNHMTNTNMQSTILIFLEDIPEEETPYLVKLYLSEQMIYMEWPGVDSPEGQIYFWKQLIKRLKINVRRNDMVPPDWGDLHNFKPTVSFWCFILSPERCFHKLK